MTDNREPPPPQPSPIEGEGVVLDVAAQFPPPLWGRVRVGGTLRKCAPGNRKS